MTEHEKRFRKWKEDTRREALEKEISRLKEENLKKHKSFKSLKTIFIITSILLITSFAVIFLVFNGQKAEIKAQKTLSEVAIKKDSLSGDQQKKATKENNGGQIKIAAPVRDTAIVKIPQDGVFFSIQIGAYLGIDLSQYDENMISLHQNSSAGINQFTLGIFSDYKKAQSFQDEVLKLGFNDAYIIAIRDGKRLKTEEALRLKQKSDTSENP